MNTHNGRKALSDSPTQKYKSRSYNDSFIPGNLLELLQEYYAIEISKAGYYSPLGDDLHADAPGCFDDAED